MSCSIVILQTFCQSLGREYATNDFSSVCGTCDWKSFTVEDSFAQLEYVLTKKHESTYETRVKGIQYKSSVEFMGLLEKYAKSLGKKVYTFMMLHVKVKCL